MADFSIVLVVLTFLIGVFIAYFVGMRAGVFKQNKHWESEMLVHRKDAVMRSRAVLGGHFSEQLAPYLPDFEFNPSECKFIGKPIDFLVFKGLDNKDVDEIVFVEVKSGNSKLTSSEKKIKEAVENKKVSWREYRVPEDITKKKDIEEFS